MTAGEMWRRLIFFSRWGQFHRDLDEEMDQHVAMKAHGHLDLQEGMPPGEARYAAQREFGNTLLLRERSRNQRGWGVIEALLQDLRYGARMLRKNPGFTVVAVVTLALGIGISTAIFSVMYSALLRPLPYRDQRRIVVVWKGNPQSVSTVGELSYQEFEDWSRQSKSFEAMAAMPTTVYGYAFTLNGPGGPREIESARVTPSFFSVLGVHPKLGRSFSASEDSPGAAPTVIMSDALWRNQFNADAKIIGRNINLSGVGYTVIGEMPRKCTFPAGAEVWTPLALMPQKLLQNRGAVFLQVIGRLKTGVSIEEAKAELTGIIEREAAEYPETTSTGRFPVVTPLPEIVIGSTRPVVYLLWAASLLLLTIGCMNATSLLFARLLVRTKEVAVRVALGATRGNLFRQFSAEGLALAVPVALLGVGAARVALGVLVRIAPQGVYGISSARLNSAAVVFACAISLLIAIVFGAAPAVAFGPTDVERFLRDSGERVAGFGQGIRFRNFILPAELFVTTILLVGAALVVHSYYNLQRVKLGFDTRNVLTAEIRLSGEKWRNPTARQNFFRELIERLQSRPEVAYAGAVLLRPLEGIIGWDAHYEFDGQDAETARKNPIANLEVVTPDYFRAIGTPLIAGRYFMPTDMDSSESAVIVNEQLSKDRFGSAADSIGKRIRLGLEDGGPWSEIVGVVGNAHYRDLGQSERDIFLPYLQTSIPLRYVVVRTKSDPASFTPILRREVERIDKDQAVAHVRTMGKMVESVEATARFSMLLFLLFGISAAVLASVGVYGIVSESVIHRRREIGIRMALGAQRGDVLHMVIREGMLLAGMGTAAGIVGALALTRFLRSMLFEIKPTDPWTFVGVAILLTIVAMAACYIPARRVLEVDPMVALRYE